MDPDDDDDGDGDPLFKKLILCILQVKILKYNAITEKVDQGNN